MIYDIIQYGLIWYVFSFQVAILVGHFCIDTFFWIYVAVMCQQPRLVCAMLAMFVVADEIRRYQAPAVGQPTGKISCLKPPSNQNSSKDCTECHLIYFRFWKYLSSTLICKLNEIKIYEVCPKCFMGSIYPAAVARQAITKPWVFRPSSEAMPCRSIRHCPELSVSWRNKWRPMLGVNKNAQRSEEVFFSWNLKTSTSRFESCVFFWNLKRKHEYFTNHILMVHFSI